MEEFIEKNQHKYTIFRLSNAVGKTNNNNTVVNFFIKNIAEKKHFNVWKNATRNIIDIDDMYIVCNEVLTEKLFLNSIVNIANPNNYPVPFVVEAIEKHFKTKGIYTLIDKGDGPHIDISLVELLFKKFNINFDDKYLSKLLQKYFPGIMTYTAAKRKRLFEQVFMFPFVLLGKIAGHFIKPDTKHNIFLFYPNGDIGGSPQVNIDLVNCIKNKKPLVIFSKKASNNQFREKYNVEGVRVLDIHKYIDNKFLHFINFFFRGLLSTWINKAKNAVVVGGESIFFYKIVPHVKESVHCVEICHLDTWLPYSIGFIDKIDRRVFSTEKLKEKVEAQYKENNLSVSYFKRLFFYDNAIDIPGYIHTSTNELQVYFIGRGAAQKRVHLIAAIATIIHNKKLRVKFNFVGDVDKVIDPAQYPFCNFFGNVKEEPTMKKIYEEADVLLMTSSFEGLPVVIMQMMAYGKVVVSTAVNGIPDYIHHMENGLLIRSLEESEIIDEGVSDIELLLNDPELRQRMGIKSKQIAIDKFSRETFCANYHELLKLDC